MLNGSLPLRGTEEKRINNGHQPRALQPDIQNLQGFLKRQNLTVDVNSSNVMFESRHDPEMYDEDGAYTSRAG